MAVKILVCGDVEGRLSQLYKRVDSIQKKSGLFDMLFCLGDFFGEDDSDWKKYNAGLLKSPVPTFILGPNKSEHCSHYADSEGGDLCDNITYLGSKGVYTGSSGLTVAYLSGLEGSSAENTSFTRKDVDSLRLPLVSDSKFKGVDILLTSQWPRAVQKYASAADGFDSITGGSSLVAQLAVSLRPRYHFCALEGVFYERQPYRNHQILRDSARHVTRVIALAKVANQQKRKWVYACSVMPLRHMDASQLTVQPPDVTESPYKTETKSESESEAGSGAQFFYDQGAIDRGSVLEPDRKRKPRDDHAGGKRSQPPQPKGPCWFCLGSPEVEKHLVISVGTQTYLALAKGGLVPEHALILPIGHHQSTVAAPEDVIAEIDKYKSALRKCFKSKGKGVVFFERNYKTSHLQIQVVPVELDLAGEVEETAQGCGLSQDIELQNLPKHTDLKQVLREGVPYFYLELPSGDKLMTRISKGFPLQFGREVLAHESLLNMPHRADWRNCSSSKEEEKDMTQALRTLFQPFDFNEA